MPQTPGSAPKIATPTMVLWGYRRGARWLWWTLVASGVPGFAAALWVHHHVGYIHVWHLAPVVIGLALFVGALALSAGFLHSGHGNGKHRAAVRVGERA